MSAMKINVVEFEKGLVRRRSNLAKKCLWNLRELEYSNNRYTFGYTGLDVNAFRFKVYLRFDMYCIFSKFLKNTHTPPLKMILTKTVG